jgi:molybdopterin-guanine dinucleotide biosynthesis protein A
MGQDKASLQFRGQPLLKRVVERMSTAAAEVLVCTNQPERLPFISARMVQDIIPGAGALGGLYTALHHAACPWVGVVACDMPFASSALLGYLYDLGQAEDVDVVIPAHAEGLEPLHAVYRKETCLPVVLQALQAGERRMISWLPEVRVRKVGEDELRQFEPQMLMFLNVNTPDEFRRAEELARDDPAGDHSGADSVG